MTTEQMLIGAIISLSTVVSFLFKLVLKSKKDCDDDRARLWRHIDALEEHIQEIVKRTCGDNSCPDREPIHGAQRPPRLHFEPRHKPPTASQPEPA